MTTATYRPQVYDVRDIEEAKQIILTADGASTEERWQNETPYLAQELGRHLSPEPRSVILDYGCGIGRLAKELIGEFGCTIIGVDTSVNMRTLSLQYLQSENFVACSKEGFETMVTRGLRVDHAYAVWVLQHCLNPVDDVKLIRDSIGGEGLLFVSNGKMRCVPTDRGFIDDGADIIELLVDGFDEIEDIELSELAVTDVVRRDSFCKLFRKRV